MGQASKRSLTCKAPKSGRGLLSNPLQQIVQIFRKHETQLGPIERLQGA